MDSFENSFTLKIEKELGFSVVVDDEVIVPIASTRALKMEQPLPPNGDESYEYQSERLTRGGSMEELVRATEPEPVDFETIESLQDQMLDQDLDGRLEQFCLSELCDLVRLLLSDRAQLQETITRLEDEALKVPLEEIQPRPFQESLNYLTKLEQELVEKGSTIQELRKENALLTQVASQSSEKKKLLDFAHQMSGKVQEKCNILLQLKDMQSPAASTVHSQDHEDLDLRKLWDATSQR